MADLSTWKLRRFQGLFYGPPGSWKTVTAHGFPRTRTLDFDDGMDSVMWAIQEGIIQKRPEDIVFETISEQERGRYGSIRKADALDWACDVVDEWIAGRVKRNGEWVEADDGWDTLIIDSGTGLSDAVTNKSLETNAALKLSNSLANSQSSDVRITRVQDWGVAAVYFQQFIDWVRTLDKNVILIAHEYAETDEQGSVISYQPLLIGQLRQKIGKDFGEVYHFSVEGTRQKPEGKIQTTPGGRYTLCKSRLGCLPPTLPSSYDEIVATVAEYYNVPKETLWTDQAGE